jgi:transposase InsO family protein
VDDATRLTCAEMLTDEQKSTVNSFQSGVIAWFNGQGIDSLRVMRAFCPAYISRSLARACRAPGLRDVLTRPYTPRTNGNAERFIQTH